MMVPADACSLWFDRRKGMESSPRPPMPGDGTAISAGEKPRPGQPATAKKRRRRSPRGTADTEAEVVALSPRTLLSSRSFLCEVCGKEFRRSQNLQIHRRGHNLPWKLGDGGRQAAGGAAGRKRLFVCPEETCVHHHPSRALGDITGIKKHYSRKHGEKRWNCDGCPKSYAVRADWMAHARVCGSRRYECDCGTLFSRKESFVVHRAACSGAARHSDGASSCGPAIDCAGWANTFTSELLFPSLWGRVSQSAAVEERPPSPTTRS
ncbi:unnamed protein product [Spirodela intermedia]|uniref:C2H2-type domain-containing protein n=1 Tax=Spirodela intermedia TaxID=51605 RepID=A0A7I8L4P0_SPIIN|nr:unnamed protein product [Spirodela intermedia]